MNPMKRISLKFILGSSAAVLLTVAPSAMVHAQGGPRNELMQDEIIQNVKAAYASLSSYSDEGTVITDKNGYTITHAFTSRLSRPNLYRIECEESILSPSSTIGTQAKAGAVWSAGEGNFLDTGSGAQKQVSKAAAFTSTTGVSGGVTSIIPRMFFNFGCAPLCRLGPDLGRQADEKIGDVDCYVFVSGSAASTQTLWIGKQDFLIRQVRYVQSDSSLEEEKDRFAREHPPRDGEIRIDITRRISTETHTNIVVNQKFAVADFVPASAH